MLLRVDADRLRADFDALAAIGATADGGVDRETFSAAHLAARAWFRERADAAGLETRIDGAANHSAVLPARDPAARTLLLGSHLDSVRRGGRFDGALGVVCALEVLRAVQDAGLELPVTLEAIDFTDEEGTLIGTLGSLALAGQLTRDDLAAPRGGRELLVAELARMGLTEEGDPRRAPRPRLARRLPGAAHRAGPGARAGRHRHRDRHRHRRRGVVHGRVRGRGAPRRDDADGRPARCGRRRGGLRARRQGAGRRATSPERVATVGDIRVEPGSFNVVPGRATLRLECRSLDARELEALERALTELAHATAEAHGLDVTVEPVGRVAPAPTAESVRAALTGAAADLGLTTMELAVGRRSRRPVARCDHAERDGVRPVARRHQPRPGRGDGVGGLRQRRQRPAQRGASGSPRRRASSRG